MLPSLRLAGCLALALAMPAIFSPATSSEVLRGVVFVANADDGTVDIIDADSFEVIRTIDVIPDGDSPSPEQDPVQAAAYPLVVRAAGVNYAQDLNVSPDGRTLYVSRGHLGDVAAFDIATGALLWRSSVGGVRADHMTISADGERLFVSALIESRVEVFDTADGSLVGSFPTGEWAHDNLLSADGARVYNGSIGNVIAPEALRGRPEQADAVLPVPFLLTVADVETLEVIATFRFERGIRPFAITADETRMYAQLSDFHGVIEYDLVEGRILRTTHLPIADGVTSADYDFAAPHHGLVLSPDEQRLCAAGRASDYVAIVSTQTLQPEAIIPVDDAPGWATNGPDGTHCFVPSTRADTVSVVSYASLEKVATIEVGAGPKYLIAAFVPEAVL